MVETFPWGINADDGSPEYDAQVARLLMRALLTGGVADRLGARSGAHPAFGLGTPQPVVLSGTTVTVRAHSYVINPGHSTGDGPYLVYFTEDTHTLDPADGSNPRIDIVYAIVYDDDHDASGERFATTEYVAGSPSATPSAPSIPDGALPLAQIDVPASPGSPTLAFVSPWTVAAGGVLPVRDSSEYPADALYTGQMLYDRAINALIARSGSAWNPVASPESPEEVVYSVGSHSFQKADYPWARKVWVRVWGAGGAGGGATTTGSNQASCGSGGGAGGYAESIIDLAALGSSVTVTVGSGGSGNAGSAGGDGGSSSFGSLVVAAGGAGGGTLSAVSGFGSISGGSGGNATAGQLQANGGGGARAERRGDPVYVTPGMGGAQNLSGGGRTQGGNSNGLAGPLGCGGAGAANGNSQSTARTGGSGGIGRVVVVVI